MGSPIFDSTFGTGRFEREEPMTTDQSQSGEALELQLFDLVELARDSRSDKGGEAKWVHPLGALVKEFTKRIAALAQSGAGQEPGNDFPDCIEKTLADLYTAPSRPDASKGISINDETLTIEWVIDGKKFGPKSVKVERPDASGLIEAAEIVKCWSQACVKDSEANLLDALAKQLRARAAGRSA